MSHWEHFHHQADIGVRGCGSTLSIAFEQTAMALTAVITDPGSVSSTSIAVPIHCEAPDRELLLADWLNALIYEMATRKLLFSRFSVKILGNELNATAWGEPIDISRHQPTVEIKGATYTELYVDNIEGIWIAQCVVDV
jgi:tRNA nucleotidyltransferase (CCA-adding enzyme)